MPSSIIIDLHSSNIIEPNFERPQLVELSANSPYAAIVSG